MQSLVISAATGSAFFFLVWFLDTCVRRLLRRLRLFEVSAEYRIADLAGADRAAEKFLSELKEYQDSDSPEVEVQESSKDEGNIKAAPIPKENDEDLQANAGNVAENIFNSSDALTKFFQEKSEGNAGLIVKYYAQGHMQASLSFILSMLAATAGFVIAAAAVISYLRNPGNVTTTVITAAVGAIIELIGFLFFRRADNGRELMMQMIDRIRHDREQERNYITTLAMLDQIDSSEIRDMMRVVVVREFSGATISLDQMTEFVDSGVLSRARTSRPFVHIRGSHAAPEANKSPVTDSG